MGPFGSFKVQVKTTFLPILNWQTQKCMRIVPIKSNKGRKIVNPIHASLQGPIKMLLIRCIFQFRLLLLILGLLILASDPAVSKKLEGWTNPDIQGSVEPRALMSASRNPKFFWGVSYHFIKNPSLRPPMAPFALVLFLTS